MTNEIIVVSGFPRSGTSLMMQMLDRAGITLVTDDKRVADNDNPRGYFEFDGVRRLKYDSSWIPGVRGKALKVVSQLLYDLPPNEDYRIIFMRRDIDEMLQSQETMLERSKRPAAPRDKIKKSLDLHLAGLSIWLEGQASMKVLFVSYNDLVANPRQEAERVDTFLGGIASVTAMVGAVDRTLYRNRQ